jgi:hypothetical protein
MTSRAPWLACGVVVAVAAPELVLTPYAAAAEPARPLRQAITVEPGATCIDASTLTEQIQSWLGTDSVDTDVVVDVRGSPEHPRVVSFRTLRSGRVVAVRTFDPGPSRCEQLHAVVGLAIAMALKASLIEEVAPSVGPTPVPTASPARPGSAPEARLPWTAALEAVAALAVLPDPAFGVEARVERALLPALRARLGLLATLAPGESFEGAPGRFTTWLLAPRLDLCAGLDVTPRLEVRGCMGMSGGGLHAEGYSYPSPRSTFLRWLAVANELGVAAELSRRWSIDADATLILPVARNSIEVRDYSGNVLFRRDLAAAGWVFGAGPLFRF